MTITLIALARSAHKSANCGSPTESAASANPLLCGVEELDLAHATADGLAPLDRQLQRGEPAPALDAEPVRDRRPADQPVHQHRVDLLLGARADPDRWPRRANRLRITHLPRSGIQTAPSDPAASNRASSRSVFARA